MNAERIQNREADQDVPNAGCGRCRPIKKTLLAWLMCCVFVVLTLLPAAGPAARSAHALSNEASDKPLNIENWQGAKNYGDHFSITVSGSTDEDVRFVTRNCSVSPSSGSVGGTFTVTVTGAGVYSLTALSGTVTSEAKAGLAGKANQTPLLIKGWGDSKDYYHYFDIQVLGGSTNGRIRFETDGCSVNPASGGTTTLFRVTVTRVGEYSLRAIMEGNANYADAYSVIMSGVAGQSKQASIAIDGWQESAKYGDSFPVTISGGSTNEALVIDASGCTVTRQNGAEYLVDIDSVGAYTLSVSRAGNYGYYGASAAVCGVSRPANQPSLSVSGWSTGKCCNDSFPIRVSGGMRDGTVHFSTSGCTVSPLSGTVETGFTVTVTTVGSYSLTAIVDGTEHFHSAASHKQLGTAGKATQNKLVVEGWNDGAAKNSSFDIRLDGGNGTGATSVTTLSGCTAMLKTGETNVYTVTVNADVGEPYSLSVAKAGDASFNSAKAQTVSGRVGRSHQVALSVSGWNDAAEPGETFTIRLAGGSGSGDISFDASGCTVAPDSGGVEDTYVVTITARENNAAYSLQINRSGDGSYNAASTLRSGSVRTAIADGSHPRELVMLGNQDAIIWLGITIVLLVATIITFATYLARRRND